jgi:hypothetical protein
MSTNLTIGAFEIHQRDGLFSLNDLHRASGAELRHRPVEFMRLEQTRALIEEIQKVGIPTFQIRRGSQGGTYACRELVIAYAAWISPAFHLKVIRVFLNAAFRMDDADSFMDTERFQTALSYAAEAATAVLKSVLRKTSDTKAFLLQTCWDSRTRSWNGVSVTPIEHCSFVTAAYKIAGSINGENGEGSPEYRNENLVAIADACLNQLSRRVEREQQRLALLDKEREKLTAMA